MIKLLIRSFIPDYKNPKNPVVREKYILLAGVLGVICNIILFITKLIVGILSGSIAVISDSFNNLTDCASSVVSVLSAKLSGKKPDPEHPFGHGRTEYVAALIVAFITMLLGFELLKGSIEKTVSPVGASFSIISVIILLLSSFIKLWMYSYNKYLAKTVNSAVLSATAKDSLSDTAATISIIAATFSGYYFRLPHLDGIVGIAVSLLIMKTGYSVAADTIGLLLGKPPEKDTVEMLINMISEGEGIQGVHDLVVHDYGPGRCMASVHAEVPDNANIVRVHEVIDFLEHKIYNETGIHMVIHMDPVAVDCERTAKIKNQVLEIIRSYNSRINMHDFRMTEGEKNINLIFDIEVPADIIASQNNIVNDIKKLIKKADSRYSCVIDVDTLFI